MSIEAWKWAREQDLPGPLKLVLIELAWYVEPGQNSCFPRVKLVAQVCGLSHRAVQRRLSELERYEVIRREPRERENRSRKSNLIVLEMPPESLHPVATAAPDPHATGDTTRAVKERAVTKERSTAVLTDASTNDTSHGNAKETGAVHGDTQNAADGGNSQNAALDGNRKNDHAPSRSEMTHAIDAVWAHYCNVMHPRSNVADSEQRRLIREALKTSPRTTGSNAYDGAVAELCRAIDGCAASPFHMGQNDRGKKYNRISNIFKGKRGGRTTREQIDMFLEIAEKAGSQSDVPAASAGRVQQARRYVLDGWEYPSDAVVVERAEEAKAWLVEQGWRIDYETGTNRPLFSR